MENILSTEEFCLYYQQMREAQNNYFASKKENRWGNKNLLVTSKRLEAELDLKVLECLGMEVSNS